MYCRAGTTDATFVGIEAAVLLFANSSEEGVRRGCGDGEERNVVGGGVYVFCGAALNPDLRMSRAR